MTAMPENNSSRKSKAATPDAAREITATRVFDAPRELVWQMWSDPFQIVRWWGPKGFSTTMHEMNFRPGGNWRFVMHGPDGRNYDNHSVYREIVEPERIVYSHLSGPLFDATATFKDLGGRTEVTVRMVFATAELRENVAREFGAVEGLHQTLGRLGEELSNVQRASQSAMATPVVITRSFDAPREIVFEAFTDAKQLAKWWGPRGFTNPVCEADARPGGEIRIDMRAPDGKTYPMGGRFREIVPPERLVFTTTAFSDADGVPQFENLNTITFAESGGQTRLTLRVEILHANPAAFAALSGMKEGWNQSFDRLSEVVSEAAAPDAFVISRIFNAPRDLMWKVWTESEQLAQWFGPKGAKVIHSKNDLRPGGVYHYALQSPEGNVIWGRWVYREVVKPERLLFVSSFSDEKGGITRHPMAPDWPRELLSTITLAEESGKTRVTVRWIPINATLAERKAFDTARSSMIGGWTGTFEQLEDYLAQSR